MAVRPERAARSHTDAQLPLYNSSPQTSPSSPAVDPPHSQNAHSPQDTDIYASPLPAPAGWANSVGAYLSAAAVQTFNSSVLCEDKKPHIGKQ
jgi:hypothetical protein